MRIYSYVKNNLNITKSEVMALDKEGRILVNGMKMNLSRNIRPGEVVTVDGVVIKDMEFSYYLYNKPKGVICTNNRSVSGNIIDKLDIDKRVYTVGRLDKDTHGLIILTNDNRFTHYVLESKRIEKEYIVEVKETIDDDIITRLAESIMINGKPTIPAVVKKIDSNHLSIILIDGRYHEVRELVKHARCHLVDLKRIRIGKILLDDYNLEEGKYIEVSGIKELI